MAFDVWNPRESMAGAPSPLPRTNSLPGEMRRLQQQTRVAALLRLGLLLACAVLLAVLLGRGTAAVLAPRSRTPAAPPPAHPDSSSSLEGVTRVRDDAAQFSGSGSSDSSNSSGETAGKRACAYGALPGTWVTSAPPGAHWQLLDTGCQMRNWLAEYAAAGRHSSDSGDTDGSSGSSTVDAARSSDADTAASAVEAGSSSDEQQGESDTTTSSSSSVAGNDGRDDGSSAADVDSSSASGDAGRYDADAGSGSDSSGSDSSGSDSSGSDSSTAVAGAASAAPPPELRVLLLSDSVDRFIVTHVCEHIGGTKHTMQQTVVSPRHEPADAYAASSGSEQGQPQPPAPRPGGEPADAAAAAGSGAGGAAPGPSSLNKTAYAFHTCASSAPLLLASSYFPGVHPTGPFHRGLAQNYRQRIDAAAAMWAAYAGPGRPPNAVSVASLLWDVARLHLHERDAVAGPELSLGLLRGWVANFSDVVGYARQAFPEARVWVTHTTMPPRFAASSGLMAKPYLGRAYHVDQLNAAAAQAAGQLGLALVDYAALARRWAPGQGYLEDAIHPNALVGLEAFNMIANLALGGG